MTARSPNAYLFSALLHCGAIGVALFLAYGIGETPPDAPKIFELVAGAGDNYAATAAPALGVAGGIKLSLPAEPAPQPEPVASAPAPLEAAAPIRPAPEPVAKASRSKAAPAKPADTVPNFTKMVQRTASRRAARLEAKYKKQLAEQERREAREEALRQKAEAKSARIDAEGIREGVIGGSAENKTGGAGGKALTREEGDLLDGYFALLKARIKENYQSTGDASDKLAVRLEFYVAADGALGSVRITRSSGNAEFDRSVLEAFHRTASIGPRPDGKGETVTMEFDLRETDAN
jgi:colicin import membrane protein